MKKQRVIILIILILAMLLFMAYVLVTRQTGMDCKADDAEYLNVFDVRPVSYFQSKKEVKELTQISESIIRDCFENNGVNTKYTDRVYDSIYQSIYNEYFECMRNKYNINFKEQAELKMSGVKVLCKGDKAIVGFEIAWTQDESDKYIFEVTDKVIPYDRIYFEKIDNKWKAVDVFINA